MTKNHENQKSVDLRGLSPADMMQYEFPPLKDSPGRKYLRTEDGFHYYTKTINKDRGAISVERELKVPATIEKAIEEEHEFWTNVQRQILDDLANKIRTTELISEKDKAKKREEAQKKLATLMQGLSEEEKKKILASL